ncbi:hypothetical protein B1218_35450 [Pseudomonas ogarae]|nr:hypothetical protein B1218_35450 [Pseudomonas ogarae]
MVGAGAEAGEGGRVGGVVQKVRADGARVGWRNVDCGWGGQAGGGHWGILGGGAGGRGGGGGWGLVSGRGVEAGGEK